MAIPKDLDECFIALRKMLDPNELDKFMTNDEGDVVLAHHGLGRWIRNNWGLWKGGELKTHLEGLGFTHPDDMSHTILLSFHRHLRGTPLELEKEAANCRKYWALNPI